MSFLVRQDDLPDAILPGHVNEVINNGINCKKWLNLILDVTTKRGHTNTEHTPPPTELGPFRPYVEPKGWVHYDKNLGLFVYDNSLS